MRYGLLRFGDAFKQGNREYIRLHTHSVSTFRGAFTPRAYMPDDRVFCPARLAELIHADLKGAHWARTFFDIRWEWESASVLRDEIQEAVDLLLEAERIVLAGGGYVVRRVPTES